MYRPAENAENAAHTISSAFSVCLYRCDWRGLPASFVFDKYNTMAGLPRRIVKETQRLQQEPVAGISCAPYEDNLRYFRVALQGPEDTPYQGGMFSMEMFLPAEYPMVPPKVHFLTKIYHPNIDKLGRICLDILKSKWSPALQMRTVLLSIQALLSAPNPDDPLDTGVADHWKANEAEAMENARVWTRKFASS